MHVVHRRVGQFATVHVDGELRVHSVRKLHEQLQRLLQDGEVDQLELDLRNAQVIDTSGAVVLDTARRQFEAAGKSLTLSNLADVHRKTLDLVSDVSQEEVAAQHHNHGAGAPSARSRRISDGLANLGQWVWAGTSQARAFCVLIVDTLIAGSQCVLGKRRIPAKATAEQAVFIGVDALPIVAMLSYLIGLILAFQAAYQLQRFGAETFMVNVVALGVVREFAAMITAIVLAGRSGAAMAAELGTMAVREELDALESMGVSPVRLLVLPRTLAITVAQPCLTILSMAIGIAGGLSISSFVGVPLADAYDRMRDRLVLADFELGLFKSVLFAWIIGFVSCFVGMRTRGSAHNVGQSTTRAVVASIFLIVVADSFVTTSWTLTGGAGVR